MPPPETAWTEPALSGLDDREEVSLCEVLDRVLHKGAVLTGELTISVADVDLLYLSLQVVLSSIETARRNLTCPVNSEEVADAA